MREKAAGNIKKHKWCVIFVFVLCRTRLLEIAIKYLNMAADRTYELIRYNLESLVKSVVVPSTESNSSLLRNDICSNFRVSTFLQQQWP